MIKNHWRDLKSRIIKERYYLRPLDQIPVKSILSLIIMQVQLRLLVGMVMVLRLGRLPESKNTNSIANPQRKHNSLHPRRVMERLLIMSFPPLLQRLPGRLNEPLQGIKLDNSGAEDVEPGIGDKQRSPVGGVADGVVEEMRRLANVDEDRDGVAVRVAEATVPPSTEVEDVAVDEGKGGLPADFPDIALGSGIVEADHEIVAVDQVAVDGIEEDAAVADDGAGGVGPAGVRVAEMEVDGAFDEGEELQHDLRLEVPAEEGPAMEGAAELREDATMDR